jgi:hypothetical protein
VCRLGDAKKAGGLAYKLVAALAAESGKTMPDTAEKMLNFVKAEIKGFDTPEAEERAAGAGLLPFRICF